MAAVTQLAARRNSNIRRNPAPRRNAENRWQEWRAPGMAIDAAAHSALAGRLAANYGAEYGRLSRPPASGCIHASCGRDPFVESVDGAMLYGIVRHFKPGRIVEIGSGFSTYLSAKAIAQNREDGHDGALTVIEPCPGGAADGGVDGLANLRIAGLPDVELSFFSELARNDLLLIDASHAPHSASGLRYDVMEMVPRLKPGVIVHFHDLSRPAHYPRDWVERNRFFWTEQYALQAFLRLRTAFEVLWAAYWMHLNHPEKLEAAFPFYDRMTSWPGSCWIRMEGTRVG